MSATTPPETQYSDATENVRKMYDQRLWNIMGRYHQSLKIDRSGGDGE
jgi:hypothetical protein